MNTIITIQKQIIGTEINSVSAKELHSFIEAKVRFNDWITRRINKYSFIENEDYVINLTKKEGNNATLKEYYITLDMAKELAMVENNDKGREARRYFIACEKKALEIQEPKKYKDNIDIENLNNRLKLLENIVANNLKDKEIIINPRETKTLKDAQTIFKVSKPNKNDNLKEKEKFYQDILEVIKRYPDGVSQRTLLSEAKYSQSNKIRRWLQEQISILWNMTIIPGKCYKYILK